MGGFLAVSTTIHGTASSPGIPFSDSPTGGIYETVNSGIGVSLTGTGYLSLYNTGFALGPEPVSAFTLALLSGSPFVGGGVGDVFGSVSPDGAYFYAIDNSLPANLSVFSRNTISGVISSVIANYVTAGNATQDERLIISPDGKFLYTSAGNNIAIYSRNPNTGLLTFIQNVASGNTVIDMVISPNGNFLYASNSGANTISAFSIDLITGLLTIIGGSPFASGSTCKLLKMSPNGEFLFGTAFGDKTIFSHPVNIITGALSAFSSTPALADFPGEIFISSDNKYAYVGTYSTYIRSYTINQINGALTFLADYILGGTLIGVSGSYDGKYIYVIDDTGNILKVFSYDSVTGLLSPVNTLGTGGNAAAHLTVTPDDKFIITLNHASNNFSVFSTTNISFSRLLTAFFDPTGGANGSIDIAGILLVNGSPVINLTVTDSRYAAIAGSITLPFSAKSLTLDNAAGGLIGTNTNNNAIAGAVGEFLQTIIASGAAVALTTGVAANVATLALTAGDWDVEGMVAYHSSGTTNVNDLQEGISAVSATLPATAGAVHCDYLTLVIPAAPDPAYGAPKTRISLAAPATIYLVTLAHFTVSTLVAYGQINARRVR